MAEAKMGPVNKDEVKQWQKKEKAKVEAIRRAFKGQIRKTEAKYD